MEVVEYCWTRSPKNTPTSWEVKEGYFDAWSTPTANREDTLLSQWGRDQMWWCSWTHGLVTEILWWPPDHKTKTIGIHFELHLSEFILGWIEEKMIEGRNRKENGKSIYWEIHFSKDQHVEESFHPRWNFKRIGLERFPKTLNLFGATGLSTQYASYILAHSLNWRMVNCLFPSSYLVWSRVTSIALLCLPNSFPPIWYALTLCEGSYRKTIENTNTKKSTGPPDPFYQSQPQKNSKRLIKHDFPFINPY